MAAATFHGTGHEDVADISDAYKLLSPLLGTTMASTLFAVALLCSGQNATLTGTLAGQIVMEGFINLRLRPWLRRLITRLIAIIPAIIVVYLYGESGTGALLVLSQVILSLQLPFAVFPLVMFTSDRVKMGRFVSPTWVQIAGLDDRDHHRGPERLAALSDVRGSVEIRVMYRRILVAVENSTADRTILDHVEQLARLTGAALLLVHVADGWVARNYNQLQLRESEEMKADRAYLAELQQELDGQGLFRRDPSRRGRPGRRADPRRRRRASRPDRDVHPRPPVPVGRHPRHHRRQGPAPRQDSGVAVESAETTNSSNFKLRTRQGTSTSRTDVVGSTRRSIQFEVRSSKFEVPQAAVCRERRRRLPHAHRHHVETLVAGHVEDQLGDALDGRVALELEDRLAERLERRDERVVVAQNHLVIELAIDPALHEPLDVRKIGDHVARVEPIGPDVDLDDGVVAVRMFADAVVVEQPVAVAEVDALGDEIHADHCNATMAIR